MFELKIHTNTNRFPAKVTSLEATVADILEQNSVSVQGATVSLNGRILNAARDFGLTFADLGVGEESTAILSVVVKAESAAR